MHKLSSIHISGPDAFDFLQGQLTNDLCRLQSVVEIPSAWCNPKGRVLWFGKIRKIEDVYALDAPAETADDIVQRMSVFRFRAKVAFELADEGVSADPDMLIRDGWPWIGGRQMEQFTPHMLNLDLLDAISFDKGCYTGQEIVARTHYKGATKRRAQRYLASHPVKAGDPVTAGERKVGEVLNVSGEEVLAVTPLESPEDPLRVADAILERLTLPYLDDKT